MFGSKDKKKQPKRKIITYYILDDAFTVKHSIYSVLNDETVTRNMDATFYPIGEGILYQELRDTLLKNKADLYLLDTDLEDGTGWDLVPIIKETFKDAHIIMLSDGLNPNLREKRAKYEADVFSIIEKPFQPGIVVGVLNEFSNFLNSQSELRIEKEEPLKTNSSELLIESTFVPKKQKNKNKKKNNNKKKTNDFTFGSGFVTSSSLDEVKPFFNKTIEEDINPTSLHNVAEEEGITNLFDLEENTFSNVSPTQSSVDDLDFFNEPVNDNKQNEEFKPTNYLQSDGFDDFFDSEPVVFEPKTESQTVFDSFFEEEFDNLEEKTNDDKDFFKEKSQKSEENELINELKETNLNSFDIFNEFDCVKNDEKEQKNNSFYSEETQKELNLINNDVIELINEFDLVNNGEKMTIRTQEESSIDDYYSFIVNNEFDLTHKDSQNQGKTLEKTVSLSQNGENEPIWVENTLEEEESLTSDFCFEENIFSSTQENIFSSQVDEEENKNHYNENEFDFSNDNSFDFEMTSVEKNKDDESKNNFKPISFENEEFNFEFDLVETDSNENETSSLSLTETKEIIHEEEKIFNNSCFDSNDSLMDEESLDEESSFETKRVEEETPSLEEDFFFGEDDWFEEEVVEEKTYSPTTESFDFDFDLSENENVVLENEGSESNDDMLFDFFNDELNTEIEYSEQENSYSGEEMQTDSFFESFGGESSSFETFGTFEAVEMGESFETSDFEEIEEEVEEGSEEEEFFIRPPMRRI